MKLRRVRTLGELTEGRAAGPVGGFRGKPAAGLFARHEPLIPFGPARDTIEEWLAQGLHVELYLQMQGHEKDSPPGVWMIRVGDRELSVEEYLLLFEDEQ